MMKASRSSSLERQPAGKPPQTLPTLKYNCSHGKQTAGQRRFWNPAGSRENGAGDQSA